MGARLAANQHFPGDVMAGGAIGWFVGDFVYGKRHNSELDKPTITQKILDHVQIGFGYERASANAALELAERRTQAKEGALIAVQNRSAAFKPGQELLLDDDKPRRDDRTLRAASTSARAPELARRLVAAGAGPRSGWNRYAL